MTDISGYDTGHSFVSHLGCSKMRLTVERSRGRKWTAGHANTRR